MHFFEKKLFKNLRNTEKCPIFALSNKNNKDMKVKEYLDEVLKVKSYQEICFVVAEMVGDTFANKHFAYHNTPIRTRSEWGECNILDSNVLNEKQPVTYWLSGVNWNHRIENGSLISLLVVSDAEYEKYYGPKDKNHFNWHSLEYIEEKILENHNMSNK